MNYNWPTKERDLQTARSIMEEYANDREMESLGLFEIVVDTNEKRMNFRLSGWVVALAKHFHSVYGGEEGDSITRRVVSSCITQGETIH